MTKQKRLLEEQVERRTEQIRQANEQLEMQKKSIEKSLNTIQTLSKFGQQLTATLDLENINRMVFNYVSSMMDTTNFGIGIFNKNKNQIEFKSFIENGNPITPFVSPMGDRTSCGVWCFINQKMIFSNHFLDEYSKYINTLYKRTSENPRSLICYPLTTKKRKIGIITVQSYREDAYTDYDKAVIENLASFLSIALDNADVYQELAQKNNELMEQTYILNKTNSLLEERQQMVEKQAEELKVKTDELSLSNVKLNQLVATKDKFFSIIAHDLKNPFSTILGFARLLKFRYSVFEEEKKIKFIDSILISANNIYVLLENLLDWSRSQMGSLKYEPEVFQINEVIKQNIDLVENMLESKNNVIETKLPNDIYVYADKNMISTIVRNLLTNAIKFTENGKISIVVNEEPKYIITHIIDTGEGIEQKNLKNLFDVGSAISTQGTKGESGTGLGLILCKEFIHKNGGQIYVESKTGMGSDFCFTLPSSISNDLQNDKYNETL